jgi:hypothetical protein
MGETPYDTWADKPMILTGEGYKPLLAPTDETEENDKIIGGEKPYKDQKDEDDIKGEKVEKVRKSVLTQGGYKVWADDKGYSQPFIWIDIKNGFGTVVKPPVAVNLTSQELEMAVTEELAGMGLNVHPVRKMTYVEVRNMLMGNPDILIEFDNYCNMTPEYDSERWRTKFGGSRKFSYYLVTDYIEGYSLNNPLLIADMKRDPESYAMAVRDLANLWKAEKQLVLGDRRADQYIITHDKRAYGIDYQFKGDKDRWEKTKDAITDTLSVIPELESIFQNEINHIAFSITPLWKRIKKIIGSK